MPRISNIGGMNTLLIGLSFLKGENADRLRKAWDTRFSANLSNTLFAVVDDSDEEYTLRNQITKEMRERKLDPQSITMVYFVDGYSDAQVDLATGMRDMGSRLGIGCNVSPDYLFVHVGTFASLSDQEKAQLINRVKKTALDGKYTFLVGRRPIDDAANDWRAEMAFLDVSCRRNNLFITSYDFGFLRYRRWNDERGILLERKSQILEELGNGGEGRFKEKLCEELRDRFKGVTEACTIIPEMIPVLPEVLKQRFCLFGDGGKSTTAKEKVMAAVSASALEAKSYVRKPCDDCTDAECEEILRRLIEEAKVGLSLLNDRNAFSQKIVYQPETENVPPLSFDKETDIPGIQKKAKAYLGGMIASHIDTAKMDLAKKILLSFNKIKDEEIQQKIQVLQNELNDIENKLGDTLEKEAFCQRVMQGESGQSAFNPSNSQLPAEEKKFLLFGDHNLVDCVEDIVGGAATPVLYDTNQNHSETESLGVFLYELSGMDSEKILRQLIP